jgi:hypothetical protein
MRCSWLAEDCARLQQRFEAKQLERTPIHRSESVMHIRKQKSLCVRRSAQTQTEVGCTRLCRVERIVKPGEVGRTRRGQMCVLRRRKWRMRRRSGRVRVHKHRTVSCDGRRCAHRKPMFPLPGNTKAASKKESESTRLIASIHQFSPHSTAERCDFLWRLAARCSSRNSAGFRIRRPTRSTFQSRISGFSKVPILLSLCAFRPATVFHILLLLLLPGSSKQAPNCRVQRTHWAADSVASRKRHETSVFCDCRRHRSVDNISETVRTS